MSYDFKISQGDFVIDENGDLAIVKDTEKLVQDVLKIVITPLGANPNNPAYGSLINQTLIGNAYDFTFTSGAATYQIKQSIENLQKLQIIQAREQPLTAAEQIAAINNVSVEQNVIDPRYFDIKISLLSKDLTPIKTGFTVNPL